MASEFRNMFTGDFVAKSYADFTEALVLAELGNFEDACVHCGECVGSYGFANDIIVTRNIVRLSLSDRARKGATRNRRRHPPMRGLSVGYC